MRKFVTSILFLYLFVFVGNTQEIRIKGKVLDTTSFDQGFNLMVVNKSKNRGSFASYKGTFDFSIDRKDTFALSAAGYKVQIFCFKDTLVSEVNMTVYLQPLHYTSAPVTITSLKTLEELRKERASLEKKETRTVTGVNALESPITALYQAFSKREKSKRLLAELEHQEKQDDILKELLRIYVHHKIIDLDDEEFAQFIEFCNINEDFLKTASDYDLVIYIKQKFEHYMRMNDYYFEEK